MAEQAEQCMQNIAAALAEAGAEMGDVVRVRYILPDRKDFEKTWYVYHRDTYFRGRGGRLWIEHEIDTA